LASWPVPERPTWALEGAPCRCREDSTAEVFPLRHVEKDPRDWRERSCRVGEASQEAAPMGMAADDITRTFEDFYRARAPGLRKYAVTIAGSDLADDACQEAWLRMWRAWGSADDERLDAWARQVVRNCCLDRGKPRPEPAAAQFDAPTTDLQPDELVLRRAEVAAIAARIRRLPTHLREVLWLREVVGLSYAEIAESLSIPIGTVMSRLHVARRRLARRLAS
jgi:RNA polymerase sigma-70 factor, ECF subfamily